MITSTESSANARLVQQQQFLNEIRNKSAVMANKVVKDLVVIFSQVAVADINQNEAYHMIQIDRAVAFVKKPDIENLVDHEKINQVKNSTNKVVQTLFATTLNGVGALITGSNPQLSIPERAALQMLIGAEKTLLPNSQGPTIAANEHLWKDSLIIQTQVAKTVAACTKAT